MAADDRCRPSAELVRRCAPFARWISTRGGRPRGALPRLACTSREVGAAFAPLGSPVSVVTKGIDLLDHERALARTGLDQAAGDQPLDGVADGVARRVVLVPELQLGPELGSRA